MSEQPTPIAFSGSIVLKAKTRAEVQALADQLAWYAVFDEPFNNKYEQGYAAKGQVRAAPLDPAAGATDQGAQIREQAAQIGNLQEQVARLEQDRADAAKQSAHYKKWLDLLTPEEHWRLVGRNVGERGIAVIAPGLGDEVLQLLARQMLDRAARCLEAIGPDHPHVPQRAADACAALIRELAPALTTTPEQATRQAERAAEIAARFKEFFG